MTLNNTFFVPNLEDTHKKKFDRWVLTIPQPAPAPGVGGGLSQWVQTLLVHCPLSQCLLISSLTRF